MIAPQHKPQDRASARVAYCDSEAIPKELKRRPQWVVHREKIPYSPKTGRRASSTDLLTWGTFFEALEALNSGEYDGVGFVFCSADPYSGIDLVHDQETFWAMN
jgi:primase-polymerase (primpol)-like protein